MIRFQVDILESIKHYKKFVNVIIGPFVQEWCVTCRICMARKGPSGKGKPPLQPYVVGTPFERIQVDILGPLPVSSTGNKYLLVVVDCFTKWPEAIPLKNKRASTVVRSLLDQVLSRHGMPLELHTDQGRNFKSQLFHQLMLLCDIKKLELRLFIHNQTVK